jgi:hypothetical protein
MRAKINDDDEMEENSKGEEDKLTQAEPEFTITHMESQVDTEVPAEV